MFCNRFVEPVEIGAGAFGTVYQALEPKAGRYVALKECACGRSSSAAMRIEEMKREYQLLKMLHHENIVPVFDFIATDDGYVIISMELASGGSLRELLRKTKFRLFESTIRNYAQGALRGLEYLHAKDVLHCDIKPENLVLCGSTVKLCDFGLSKQCVGSSADGHHTANISGTPRYMAPELWDTNTYTQASDIWALGCTLAELATGSRPWEGSIKPDAHDYAVMFFVHGLLSNPAAYDPSKVVPGHLTVTLRDMLCKMLCLDPTKRPTAAQCLQLSYFEQGELWREDEGMECEDSYDALLMGIHSSPPTSNDHMVDGGGEGHQQIAHKSSHSDTAFLATAARSSRTGSDRQDPNRTPASALQKPTFSEKAAAHSRTTSRSRHIADGVPAPGPVTDDEEPQPLKNKIGKVVWVFQNGRQPCPYDDEAQLVIEKAFQAKEQKVVISTVRKLDGLQGTYEIEFEQMRQRNMSTNYRRKVERRVEH